MAILLGLFLLLVFPKVWWRSERSYEHQTERYHQNLREILKKPEEDNRRELLKDLAREVGAGSERTDIVGAVKRDEKTLIRYQNVISESELVQNINNALQTRTMIAASKATTKSYVIAFAATVASVFSAVAAWRSAGRGKGKL